MGKKVIKLGKETEKSTTKQIYDQKNKSAIHMLHLTTTSIRPTPLPTNTN